jgi:proton-translocating NADH-quinone oxidoreductase chain N
LQSLLILVPLLCLMLFNLPWRRSTAQSVSFAAGLAFLAAQAAGGLWGLLSGGEPFADPLAGWLSLRPSADGLSYVMLIAVAVVAAAALSVGRAAFADARDRFLFTNLLFVSIIGMNGTALSSDLFSLYVFFEAASVASFILIAFPRGLSGLEGSFKYLVMSTVATVLMLTGIGFFMLSGAGTSFAEVRAACILSAHPGFARLGGLLFMTGLFIKGGVVPFHGWLPDAYGAAPAPVSVLLAGIVTKATGVYGLIRLAVSVIPVTPQVQTLLMTLGLVSIFVGALAAIGQSDYKRMLAYSSVSQVGYIVLALGCRTPLALAGAVFHLLNHAVFKSLLFTNAAAVESRLGHNDMNRMGGLQSRMPWTGVSAVIGLLSTAGIPPLGGFWSKVIILLALWQAGFHAAAALALIASLITLAYFLGMQRRVFFGLEREADAGVTEASAAYLVPQLVLAGLTVALGLGFPLVYRFVLTPIQQLLW